MEWGNIFRGIMIGASNVVPGISGGTIAVLLGIYDRLIFAINNLFSRKWKDQLTFLIPLGIGMVIATFLFSSGLKWLFEHYPNPTQFSFIGLIIGTLPLLFKESKVKGNIKGYHILLLILSVIIAASFMFFRGDEGLIITEIDLKMYIFLLFSGFLASAAMILPGISGSLILLMMGVYGTIINAVTQLQLDILIVIAVGVGIGVITISKVISYLWNQYPLATYMVIIGLVIGSIFVIFPGWPLSGIDILLSGLALLLGLVIAYLLGRVEYKDNN